MPGSPLYCLDHHYTARITTILPNHHCIARITIYCQAHLSFAEIITITEVVFVSRRLYCSLHRCVQVITDLRSEEKNLQRVISISDEMIKRQKRELDTLISERDILGSQLVRRNDELSLLYQKVKLLQILIANGNRAYDTRIEVSPSHGRAYRIRKKLLKLRG